jgi:hypothetical protein
MHFAETLNFASFLIYFMNFLPWEGHTVLGRTTTNDALGRMWKKIDAV